MKFKDYKYERINIETVVEFLDKQISKLKSDLPYEEEFAIIRVFQNEMKRIETLYNIAGVRYTLNVNDEFYKQEREFFDLNIPKILQKEQEFGILLLNSKYKNKHIKYFGKQLFDLIEIGIKTFDPCIMEDLQKENLLTTEYVNIISNAAIEFDGKTLNLSELNKYSHDANREVRKAASDAAALFFHDNDEKVGQIYDELVKLRDLIAKKLGYENFIELGYLRMKRIGYTKFDVENYRADVLKYLTPLASKLTKEKSDRFGFDVKNYDANIDFKNGNPSLLGDEEYLVNQALTMYKDMSKETGEFFEYMIENGLLELTARKGKSGGGYCTYFADYNSPFIFSNFNGTSADVDVLTHEAGHAFQVYACEYKDLSSSYAFPTSDACEIHSMSMEYFGYPYMDKFFTDANKYKHSHLLSNITFVPYGVLVDHFQHEVYKNPSINYEERKRLWRKLEKEYMPFKVYDNEYYNEGLYWYRQAHIFEAPFYYIDYVLATNCAWQFLILNEENHNKAWESYLKICKIGGKLSFLDIVKQAKLKSPFIKGNLKTIIEKVEKIFRSIKINDN